jgi:hypothetical protein
MPPTAGGSTRQISLQSAWREKKERKEVGKNQHTSRRAIPRNPVFDMPRPNAAKMANPH